LCLPAAALLLACITGALGAAAVARGVAQPLPLAPQWQDLGEGLAGAAEVAGILAVLLACYVGHQNLHPLLPLLRPYTGARMRGVLAVALAVAAVVFSVLCVGSALAFGPNLEVGGGGVGEVGWFEHPLCSHPLTIHPSVRPSIHPSIQINVLSNLSIEAMTPLLGSRTATAASLAVQFGYCVSLMASLLLYMHPLRTALAEVIWPDASPGDGGSPGRVTPEEGAAVQVAGGVDGVGMSNKVAVMESRHYYALTYSLLAAATLAAISVPSKWFGGGEVEGAGYLYTDAYTLH